MEDLFNANVTLTPQGEKSNPNEFKPKSSKNSKGVYEAVIRFLPNPKSPNESLVGKNTAFLKNSSGQQREIDCVNDSYSCPVATTFFQLYNNANPVLKERANTFSRKMRYSALVQIISAPDEPELVNQVKVFRFGKMVYDKICTEQTPSSGIVAQKAHNIFSFTDGRPFYIRLVPKTSGNGSSGGKKFDDWAGCQFIDNDAAGNMSVKCPITDASGNTQYYPITEQTLSDPNFKQAVVNWLNGENIPLLEPYKYHEWDDETRQFVSKCITEALDPNTQPASRNTTPTAGGIFGTAPTGPAATPQPGVITPAAPAPQAAAPTVNVAPPAGGINFNAAPQPTTAPGGFAGSNVNAPNLSDILGGGAGTPNPQPAAQPAAPAAQPAAPKPAAAAPAGDGTGGLQLGDILGDIM